MATAEKWQQFNISSQFQNQKSLPQIWPAPGRPAGIRRGGVIELAGSHQLEWLTEFEKLNPELEIFRDEKNLHALTLRRIMQSQMFEVIIAKNNFRSKKLIQVLQIFAEKSNTALFLLGERYKYQVLPISLQLEITEKKGDFILG